MNDICQQRLRNQHLASQSLKDPVEVLKSLVAIQGQDYAGSKWGLAQRTRNCTNDQVEEALTDGRILRLHVMRPTWHLVSADDIRWLVQLTAPRVQAACSSYFRKAGLDDRFLRRTNKVITKALAGGRQLTRAELREAVVSAGIEPGDSTRFGHILLRAELDGLICSGARKGNQFTYALLAERAPRSRILEWDEALVDLRQCTTLCGGVG
jgi:winged helix DNA-binding protein